MTSLLSVASRFVSSQPSIRTALRDVLAVGNDLNLGRRLQCFQPRDDRLQLHLIVGRQHDTAGDFFLGP